MLLLPFDILIFFGVCRNESCVKANFNSITCYFLRVLFLASLSRVMYPLTLAQYSFSTRVTVTPSNYLFVAALHIRRSLTFVTVALEFGMFHIAVRLIGILDRASFS